ncbi:MAG: PilZ domain-containing protein [Acidobacteria bacterium]|nr:MAG: PilZ domain-containing protein [Acidobacteriota bacterium]
MIRDRRSGGDRRKTERFETNIEIEWEGLIGKRKGVITDISTSGCFILCSGEVEDGESVKIFFPLTDGRKVQFWGEVVNHVYEIGFAIRFVELTEAQKEFLEIFVDTLRND